MHSRVNRKRQSALGPLSGDTSCGESHTDPSCPAAYEREFNIPGITFGARYDGSPVLPEPDGPIPEDSPTEYSQSGLQGGRSPYWWLADGASLFDIFGFDWTLLCLRSSASSGDGLIEAAGLRGLDLKVVDLDSSDVKLS